MIRITLICAFISLSLFAATTNQVGHVVLIDNAGNTRPAQSVATPQQVDGASAAAAITLETAQALQSSADAAKTTAEAALARTSLYRTNFIVTSTVYVQSIGGVPYDPSNQTIHVKSIVISDNVTIVATVAQTPLIPPVLDWRQSANVGPWSNSTATTTEVEIPAGATNAAAAYQFVLPKPAGGSAFFRVSDNSTGASGSGLYWMVFGGISVDGNRGMTGAITNGASIYQIRGGIVVNPTPL